MYLQADIKRIEPGAGDEERQSKDKENKIIIHAISEEGFAAGAPDEAYDEIYRCNESSPLQMEADKEEYTEKTFYASQDFLIGRRSALHHAI